MAYALTSYDFTPFPGHTVSNDANPKYALFTGKTQYKLTIDATGGSDFVNKAFYFNPALFRPTSIPQPNPYNNLKGFFADTNGKTPGATLYSMSLVTGANEENVRNYNAKFKFVSNTQIEITFDFY